MPNNTVQDALVGAIAMACIDEGLELPWELGNPDFSGRNTKYGQYLYAKPVLFLPPVDDMLVTGVPILAYLATEKGKTANNLALGAMLYGIGQFVKGVILSTERAIRNVPQASARRAATPSIAQSIPQKADNPALIV